MHQAFLELATHEEAKAMADFYQRKPAMVNGKEVQLYLSREIAVIDVSSSTSYSSSTFSSSSSSPSLFSSSSGFDIYYPGSVAYIGKVL